MLKTVKTKIKAIKEENIMRKEERARIAREKAEEEARKECARIQAEKDALMALSEKELMVEAIMVLKGYNTLLNNIEKQQEDLKDSINSLQWSISSLDSAVDEVKKNKY